MVSTQAADPSPEGRPSHSSAAAPDSELLGRSLGQVLQTKQVPGSEKELKQLSDNNHNQKLEVCYAYYATRT